VAAPFLSGSACVMVGGEIGSKKDALVGDDQEGDSRIGRWGATPLYRVSSASRRPNRPSLRAHAPHTGASAAARAGPQPRKPNPPPPPPPAGPSRQSESGRCL